jgi:replication factor A1
MAVKDLEARQGNVNLTLEIVEKGDIREFEKFGKKGRVCNAVAKDATGSIKLTLWNDDIDKVNAGDTIKIENGWVGEWQGELQLSTGKFGKLAVVESNGDSSKEASVSADEVVESQDLEGNKTDEGEHILTEDEKVEEETLDSLDEEPPIEEELIEDDVEKKE